MTRSRLSEEIELSAEMSRSLFERAKRVSPGGVHGARRFYRPFPRYFQKMEGQYLWDVDGHRYLDLNGAWGTAVLGYNDPSVRAAVTEVLEKEGSFFGPPSAREVELSEKLVAGIPCADMVALCGGGGSDPLYFALRLSRSVTGRQRLLKFEGGYHGWHDPLAVSVHPRLDEAGPPDGPRAVPVSAGASAESASASIGILNDEELLEGIFVRSGGALACAVIEPVNHSSGCILVRREFLQRLRRLCTEYGVLLIFDEILTGFRHSLHGAQSLLGVTPDLAAFGKAMANGFPIAALVGRRDLMAGLMPSGGAFYSGTYNAHLLGVTAAQATIQELERRDIYSHLFALGRYVASEVTAAAREHDILAVCQAFGSVYCVYFGNEHVSQWRDIANLVYSGSDLNLRFHQALLRAGIYMHPHLFNRSFLSAAHTMEDAERIVDVTIDFMRLHREEINAMGAADGRRLPRD